MCELIPSPEACRTGRHRIVLYLDGDLVEPERSSFPLRAHYQRLSGGVPLGIRSSSAEVISDWFQGRVPVRVSLPHSGDQPAYQIEGAGLAPFDGAESGFVAYRVKGQEVSLLIAPISAAPLAARKQVRMKSLVIHYDEAVGSHIVTWAVPKKGITYALVSDHRLPANQSCIVCHAGPKDSAFMQSLLSQ